MFLHLSVSHLVHGEACMMGGIHGKGSICGSGGMRGSGGHAWQGVCMVGACMAEGTWVAEGIGGRRHAWKGACMAGGDMCGSRDSNHGGWYASYCNAYLL